ncbi:MAG: ice-binding family protein [Syntrophales bacterium]
MGVHFFQHTSNGVTGVLTNTNISATFSEWMDPLTITTTTFTLKQGAQGTTAVLGTVDYNGVTAVFTPLSPLSVDTYTATITTGAKDLAGNQLAGNQAPLPAASDYVWIFWTANPPGPPPPASSVNLGLAAPFGIASTAGITNVLQPKITHIEGDVILASPTPTCNFVSAVPGDGTFGACGSDGSTPTINGTVIVPGYPDAATATNVKIDMNAAFLSITPLAGPPAVGTKGGGTIIASPTNLGALTGSAPVVGQNLFFPGTYTAAAAIGIHDDLTLDAQGNPNAEFFFQAGSTLTLAAGAAPPATRTRILLVNGAKASNVWWQVGSSATIGTYAEFQGNILAAFDITINTNATSCGRLMSGAWVGGSGRIDFSGNVISVPGNPFAPPAGYSAVCQ